MKKLSIAILALFSIFMLTGCDLFAAAEKEFSGAGITITLNEDFSEEETVLVPFYLESFDHIFMGSRESKSLFSGTYVENLNDYADAVLDVNEHTGTTTYESEDGDYIYAYYTSTVDDIDYGYMMICMEGSSHYYTMNFGCLESDLENSKDQYIEWANTIVVE